MKKIIFLLFTGLLSLALPAQSDQIQNGADQQLDSILQAVPVHQGKRPVHNFLLYAKNQRSAYVYHGAAGIVGRNETPVQANYQFKVASITKTFVATIILQLIEEGKLSYDSKVYPYLSNIDHLDFENFHILDGKKFASEITVAQLLRHHSGIADIFTDKKPGLCLGFY